MTEWTQKKVDTANRLAKALMNRDDQGRYSIFNHERWARDVADFIYSYEPEPDAYGVTQAYCTICESLHDLAAGTHSAGTGIEAVGTICNLIGLNPFEVLSITMDSIQMDVNPKMEDFPKRMLAIALQRFGEKE